MRPLTYGELFAGIGGIGRGLEMANGGGYFEPRWQVEADKFALKVLEKHWPNVPRFEDVRTFPPKDGNTYKVDLIAAGFPCQDISLAGKGEGLEGKRSGLFFEVMRIAKITNPRFILLENVAALLGRGMGEVLGALAALGYDAEWHSIPASHIGAPQKRERVFILAYTPSQRTQGLRAAREQIAPPHVGPWLSMRESPRGRERFWQIEPRVGRVVNGIPPELHRAKRIKTLGNAVVPQVAQYVAESLLDSLKAA